MVYGSVNGMIRLAFLILGTNDMVVRHHHPPTPIGFCFYIHFSSSTLSLEAFLATDGQMIGFVLSFTSGWMALVDFLNAHKGRHLTWYKYWVGFTFVCSSLRKPDRGWFPKMDDLFAFFWLVRQDGRCAWILVLMGWRSCAWIWRWWRWIEVVEQSMIDHDEMSWWATIAYNLICLRKMHSIPMPDLSWYPLYDFRFLLAWSELKNER